jgi:hypothetical protein
MHTITVSANAFGVVDVIVRFRNHSVQLLFLLWVHLYISETPGYLLYVFYVKYYCVYLV